MLQTLNSFFPELGLGYLARVKTISFLGWIVPLASAEMEAFWIISPFSCKTFSRLFFILTSCEWVSFLDSSIYAIKLYD
jgi:hypothetical protein